MNCPDIMKEMDAGCVDVILTSPPYNTNKKGSSEVNTNTVHAKQGESFVEVTPIEGPIKFTPLEQDIVSKLDHEFDT